MKVKNRRKNLFIKQAFHGKSILKIFLWIMLACVIFTVILGALSLNALTMMYADTNLRPGAMPFIMLKRVFASYLIFVPVGGIFIVLISLFLTHRIAGPIYRFEKTLDDMIKGHINHRIHLRKGDEGDAVASKINEFNIMLTDRILQMKKLSAEIEAVLVKTADNLAAGQHDRTNRGNIENLTYAIDVNREMKRILYDFNTPS